MIWILRLNISTWLKYSSQEFWLELSLDESSTWLELKYLTWCSQFIAEHVDKWVDKVMSLLKDSNVTQDWSQVRNQLTMFTESCFSNINYASHFLEMLMSKIIYLLWCERRSCWQQSRRSEIFTIVKFFAF